MDLPFFPGMANGEFLSKIGESGPDLETVTYEVWMTDDILTPDNTNWGDRVKKAYRTATVAPGKYWDYDMQRYEVSIPYHSLPYFSSL